MNNTNLNDQLKKAVQSKDLQKIQELIDLGASVQSINLSMLYQSYTNTDVGTVQVTQLLLENGANPNCWNNRAYSPLCYAAMNGLTAVAKLLLAHKADVNYIGNYKRTALIYAAGSSWGSRELIQLLLDYDADTNHRDQSGNNALYALILGQHTNADATQVFIDAGIDLEAKSNYYDSYLHAAAYMGKTAVLKVLVEHAQMDIDQKDSKGRRPIFRALTNSNKSLEAIKYLFYQGANIERESKRGLSVLEYAASQDDLVFIGDILQRKEDQQDSEGALAIAAENGNLRLVQFFVEEAQIDLEEQGRFSQDTALIKAAYYGRLEVVTYLLNRGASMLAINYEGNTPLLVAAKQGKLSTVCLLLERGANINESNRKNQTALMLAIEWRQEEVVAYLLEQGADTTVIDSENGLTALSIAMEKGVESIVDLLKGYGAEERGVERTEGCTIVDCSICKYLSNEKELSAEVETPKVLQGLSLLCTKKQDEPRGSWSKNSLWSCPNCQTHYYQRYLYIYDYMGWGNGDYENKLYRLNNAQLPKTFEQLKLKVIDPLYQKKTIDLLIAKIEQGGGDYPKDKVDYMVECIADYFIEQEDWRRIERYLLKSIDPFIVLKVIKDWALLQKESKDRMDFVGINQRALVNSNKEKTLSFLKRYNASLLVYLHQYQDTEDQKVRRALESTVRIYSKYVTKD